MELASQTVNARETLVETLRQLKHTPGTRQLKRDGGFYALMRSGLHRYRPSRHDHYAVYPELHVVDGGNGHICVVGYGHVFNGVGEATGGGRFTAIPFEPAMPVADGVLSAYVAGEIADTDRYAALLEHTAESPIRIHSGHAWNELRAIELLSRPFRDHRRMFADNFLGYAPNAAGAIADALRALIGKA